jgi:hypothetical protein
MALCDQVWRRAAEKTTTYEEELLTIDDVLSQTSPQLIRILHAYTLLYDSKRNQNPALYEICHVLHHLWDELRAIICPIRASIGEDETALERHFLAVSHRTRIHVVHPDPTLGVIASSAMRVMAKLTVHQLPKPVF